MIKKVLTITALAMVLSTGAYAQTAPQAPSQGGQGQALVQAEEMVRAARGECRLIAQGSNTDPSPVGKAARSGAYQQCMASKRAGTYVAPIRPQ